MDERRRIPRTDALLAEPRLREAVARLGRPAVVEAVHAAQERARTGAIAVEAVLDAALDTLPAAATQLRPVLNATGVVVHTNLGRAPLSDAARAALQRAAGYVDVEFDLDTGRRARRGRGALDALLRAVPEAQDALVVNNNAAALVLVVAALTTDARREVVVSRGELVEIGDGFRLPDLLVAAGATLREVGTTNRTTLNDYASAVCGQTAFVMKVHPSNFHVTGFTESVPVERLATLGAPLVVDIGSGLLARDPALPGEPDARSALAAGAALVCASGDKLLGGPQAGLLLGSADRLARLRRHPLARAVRADKLALAALEATVRGPQPPVHDYVHAEPHALRRRAEALRDALADGGLAAEVRAADGAVGGGGAPEVRLPGWAVAVDAALAEPLRRGDPPVVARVHEGRCLLDLRCVAPADDAAVAAAVLVAAKGV